MANVACPSCGEEERLMGSRRGDVIHVFCQSCGKGWDRDLEPKCAYCGSKKLRHTPIPIWGKGRGTMQTPAGTRDAWTCEDCGDSDATRKK